MTAQGTVAVMNVEDGELHGTPEEQRQQINGLLNFGMHNYYDQLSEHMFPTVFVNVSRKQAEAWRIFNIDSEMSEEQKSHFQSLKDNVAKAISDIRKNVKNPKSRIFVKLSSRSPKDAVWQDKQRILPILKEQFSHHHKDDLNAKMISLRRSFLKASAVNSADEAFELMKWSSRIISDLKIFLTASENSEWFDIKIVVRQFIEDLDVSNEFRGFVKDGKLTALSQYQTECYFPEIAKNADKIANNVKTFFNDVLLDKFPQWAKEGSVIDFAVVKDKVYIVELNPYGPCSGACLFNWQTDKEILSGNKPFEIRVVQDHVEHLEAYFSPWSELIKEAQKKKGFLSSVFHKK
ncbi:hypothetical protein TRFO_39856 [Tritrichomonas foetus]|uniref:Cell division cycle protein 123 n=1 Tax=Tritrichomonas foetus TaxID=1144522 RepID=A0A1J4J9M9_9EUKA|nr:hypothetical protein TRFO_39856 [Tritrichomonas foetus]|eukprot:OHS93948.1 hypothetical protein TRFO_39856 [Tritrichomonas foetus]